MAQIEYIKDIYENEEVSLREIARRTGHSFETVRKYAYQTDWSNDSLPNVEPYPGDPSMTTGSPDLYSALAKKIDG